MTRKDLGIGLTVFFVGLACLLPGAFATQIKECKQKLDEIKKECKDTAQEAVRETNARSAGAGISLQSAGKSAMGAQEKKVLGENADTLGKASIECQRKNGECDAEPACKNGGQDEAQELERLRNNCKRDIQGMINNLKRGETAQRMAMPKADDTSKESAAAKGGDEKGGEKKEEGKGGGAPPGGAPPPPPGGGGDQAKKEPEPPKQPENKPIGEKNASVQPDCANPNFAADPKCVAAAAKTEELAKACTADSSRNSQECRGYRAASFCASNSQCPNCKSNFNPASITSASGNDLDLLCSSTCVGHPESGPALAGNAKCREKVSGIKTQSTASGLAPASSGSAASGTSGSSSSGGGSSGQARLGPSAEDIKALAEGNREGLPQMGSLGVDGSGGFSNNVSESGARDDESSPFASLRSGNSGDYSSFGPAKRSTASYESPVSDVQFSQRANVFKISSDTIQNGCAKGRFNNCGPNARP